MYESFLTVSMRVIPARRAWLGAALMIGCLGSSLQAANVVVNGDFSSNAAAFGTFPGYLSPTTPANPAAIDNWTHITGANGGVNGDTIGVGQPFAPSDNSGVDNFLFMQGTDGAFGFNLFSQTITLQPNQEYSISWAAASRANNTATGRVQVGDASTEIFNSGNTAWSNAGFTTFNDTFTTGPVFDGAVSIQLYNFTGGDNTVAYSNIVVEAVPEPGTTVLLGIALLTGAFRRRR
jgi:hypothetical protein